RSPRAYPRSWSAASRGCSSRSTSRGTRRTASFGSSRPRVRGSPKMREVQLRIPLGLGKRLHEVVFAHGLREGVVFCLVSHVEIGSRTVLLVRHVVPLDDDAYLDDSSCGAAWRGSAMLPVIDAAMKEDLGIVVV